MDDFDKSFGLAILFIILLNVAVQFTIKVNLVFALLFAPTFLVLLVCLKNVEKLLYT